VPGMGQVSILGGALSPRMVRVAGKLADDVVTWLAYAAWQTSSCLLYRQRRLASSPGSLRPGSCRFATTSTWPAPWPKASSLAISGWTTTVDCLTGGRDISQRFGGGRNGARVEKQLQRYADIGITELWPVVLSVGDREPRLRRTRVLLASLSPSI
jgi:5,10-methylenetetrahydromethanopterin reductase